MDKSLPGAEQDKAVPLSGSLIEDFLDRQYDKLDKAPRNGFISRTELTSSLHSHALKGTDAKVAETILENFHDTELQSNDEWGTENNGITRNDGKLLEQNRKLKPDNPLAVKIEHSLNATEHDREKFINLVSVYKSQMDDDGNGTISNAELKAYVQSSKDGTAAVGAAKFLLDHFDDINQIGSANSRGSFKGLLAGDSNPKAIGPQELTSLAQVLGPERAFRKQLNAAVSSETGSASEIGKQGRIIAGKGDSGAAALIGIALEIAGSAKASHARNNHELLLDEFQQRKEMIDSWKFFK